MKFALDRIVEAEISDVNYLLGDSDDIDSLFADVVGVNTSDDDDVDDIVVRVYGKQRNYFEGTPLHRSQQLIKRTKDYSDYRFHLRPEYEFRHEILRLGQDAEILSPEWLREEMRWHAEEILKRYSKKIMKPISPTTTFGIIIKDVLSLLVGGVVYFTIML